MFKRIIVMVICLLAATVYAADEDSQTKRIVHEEITAFMQQNQIPGVAVELYVDGKPQSYYFGVADSKQKKEVTGRTIFELGSITKLFTCLLLAEEVDSATMQLDDSITKYLSQLPSEYEDITLLNLATHTAGLPFNAPSTVANNKELMKYLQKNIPEDSADSEWNYSNLGMRMLGMVLEKIEKKELNELYIKKILNRLRMQPIGLRVSRNYQPYYAQGYDADGQPVKSMSVTDATGAGGMKATASDMQRFLSAAIGLPGTPERLLYPIRMAQSPYVITPDFMQGLGWEVHSLADDAAITDLLASIDTDMLEEREISDINDKPVFDENDLIDKTGATDGFRSYIALIPAKKTGIVILANKKVDGEAIVGTARTILFKLNHLVAPVVSALPTTSDVR